MTCYFSDDIDKIVDIIEREFLVDPARSVDKGEQLGTREFGYRSVHRVAKIGQRRSRLGEYDRYKSLSFEIQIRTVVQHAWAEIEHDLGYKQEAIPEPMSRRFSMLAGVLELVDYEFMALRDQLTDYKKDADEAAMAQATDTALDLATLTAIIEHDKAVRRLDEGLAAVTQRRLQVGGMDTRYLEQRLSALRSVGVNSISEARQAVDAWGAHVIDFAPRWIELQNDGRRERGESLPSANAKFPQGVGFFYLWLVMGLEGMAKGHLPSEEMLTEPGATAIWKETVAEIGPAPALSMG